MQFAQWVSPQTHDPEKCAAVFLGTNAKRLPGDHAQTTRATAQRQDAVLDGEGLVGAEAQFAAGISDAL
jgi:hypothetical protein